ncbi:MAG: hypothetical protein V4733_01515 [Verrucomicrobiota bacterium]
MKIPLFLLIAAVSLSSCRTVLPLDPNTGRPSTRCLPFYTTTTTTTVYESTK